MTKGLITTVRLASILACLIVIASFAVFVVEQTKEGSNHQVKELGGPLSASTSAEGTSTAGGKGKREGSVHKDLTEASNTITSPFAGIISSSSEWATHGFRLLLALIVYGLGIGYLVRLVRIRI